MILTKEIEITINSANIKHFYSLGYENLKPRNKLIIPVEHLNKGSHSLVKVKCDICDKERELIYRFYLKSFKKQGNYCCSSKCGADNLKKTCLEKYGVDNYSKTAEYKEKIKKTCLKNYGVENPSQSIKIRDKRKNTMIERHGVEYYVLSEDFFEKSKTTSLINYGTSHPMMSDKMKKLKKEYYVKNGFNVTTNEFELYKNKVYRLTKKYKKELLINWNGYDFYDNEYIKDNFNLPGSHGKYPTIDHKISIFDGFKNNMREEDIADISNLCFTKRCINSKKYKNSFYL